MSQFLARLKERKVVQWALAYAAAAFALLQGFDIVGQRFAWLEAAERAIGWTSLWDKYGAPDVCKRTAAGGYACE